MEINWEKKGFIWAPQGEYEWMQSHTTPIAVVPINNIIRVFFSCRSMIDRNKNYVSYIGIIDLDVNNPKKIIKIHNQPVLKLGNYGTFDEFGTMVAKPVVNNNSIYLFYMGWQRLSSIKSPYQVALGLAISDVNSINFNKYSEGPILGIDSIDPISIGNVSVIIENNLWKMWYTTFTKWAIDGIKPTPEYNIKYAESIDGKNWIKKNIVCIDINNIGGVATPSVIKLSGKYHMWFGYRKAYDENGFVDGYKIGYATSEDGKVWERDDNKSIISNSETGWDSKMVCYPHVIKIGEKLLMFYCGNEFGKEGFGYAECKLNEL